MSKEMEKLWDMLRDAGIPHEYILRPQLRGAQICYPTEHCRVVSVISGPYAYGGQQGLLEIMGLLTPEERESDSVVGYLTAEDVFARIKQHWDENGGAADAET